MYKISVPVMNADLQRMGREKIYEDIRAMDAERVFLALSSDCLNENQRQKELTALRENSIWFHERGLEVGAWLWAFMDPRKNDYERMSTAVDCDADMPVCPLDDAHTQEQADLIADIAQTGVDMIMFDDDYRFGFQPGGFGCVCKNHLSLIGNELHETVTKEQMRHYMLFGGKNKYRDALLKVNGEALERFALKMRKAVDSVAPFVRLGFCACLTSWDIDGTTPDKISRIMAGNTKPFYRLIGAPYWAALKCFHCRLGDVIDYERLQSAENTDKDIEIFGEGDVYPRPRYVVPANFLEGFDTALRACGSTQGILKYGIDYNMNAGYETGYARMHIRNKPLYRDIDRLFENTVPTGVRVYVKMTKYADFTVPKDMEGKPEIQDLSLPAGARFLTALSMPLCYRGENTVSLAFGEDVNAVPETALKNGIILDARAAWILQQSGVDTGLLDVGGAVETSLETAVEDGCRVHIMPQSRVLPLTIRKNARVLSEFKTSDGVIPAGYVYENAQGGKFAVFAFDGYFCSEGVFRHYVRQKQVYEIIRSFFGKPLPAFCPGNPDLYSITSQNENGIAVGLWNFSLDPVLTPQILLSVKGKITDTVNCRCELCEDRVILSDEIEPFGFAGFFIRTNKEA